MTSARLDTTTHSTPDTYHELCHAVRPLRIMLEPLNEAWKGQQFHARWGFRYPQVAILGSSQGCACAYRPTRGC